MFRNLVDTLVRVANTELENVDKSLLKRSETDDLAHYFTNGFDLGVQLLKVIKTQSKEENVRSTKHSQHAQRILDHIFSNVQTERIFCLFLFRPPTASPCLFSRDAKRVHLPNNRT